jgi:hypothetical protein
MVPELFKTLSRSGTQCPELRRNDDFETEAFEAFISQNSFLNLFNINSDSIVILDISIECLRDDLINIKSSNDISITDIILCEVNTVLIHKGRSLLEDTFSDFIISFMFDHEEQSGSCFGFG